MTSINGSISIPKDFKFENTLRLNFQGEDIDRIIYYDTCVISIKSKSYGKIVITNDYIYTFNDGEIKPFEKISFGDIGIIELINDFPEFIFGPMRNECIHIRITKRGSACLAPKYMKPVSASSSAVTGTRPPATACCAIPGNLASSANLEEQLLEASTPQRSPAPAIQTDEQLHFYVLNSHSPILAFLRQAQTDYLIRASLHDQSMSYNGDSHLSLSPGQLTRLFDSLVQDVSHRCTNREFLLELLQAGQRYQRIRVLFWSRTDLFGELECQVCVAARQLCSSDQLPQPCPLVMCNNNSTSTSSRGSKVAVHDALGRLDVLLRVLSFFLSETDHLPGKYETLRSQAGAKHGHALLGHAVRVLSHLHRVDSASVDTFDENSEDEIALEIDLRKQQLIVDCVPLLYYLTRSAQATFENRDDSLDRVFNLRVMMQHLEMLDNDPDLLGDYLDLEEPMGAVDRCCSQILRMLLVWIFPAYYRLQEWPDSLNARQVVVIFQFLSTMRAWVRIRPALLAILRREMREELSYFSISELPPFRDRCPLTEVTLTLLHRFHANVLSDSDTFVD